MALKILNPVLACVFAAVLATALLHESIPRETYETLHPLLGYSFAVLLLVHIFLNRRWIRTAFFHRTGRRREA